MARYNNKRKQSLMMCMVSILLFIFGVTAGISYAYFTDHKEVSNTLNFGKLVVSANGNAGTSTASKVFVFGNASSENNGFLGVGDTIDFKGTVGLEENSINAYVRIKLDNFKYYQANTTTEATTKPSSSDKKTFISNFLTAVADSTKASSGTQQDWTYIDNYLYYGKMMQEGSSNIYTFNSNIEITEDLLPTSFQGLTVQFNLVIQAIQASGAVDSKGIKISDRVTATTTPTADKAEIVASATMWESAFPEPAEPSTGSLEGILKVEVLNETQRTVMVGADTNCPNEYVIPSYVKLSGTYTNGRPAWYSSADNYKEHENDSDIYEVIKLSGDMGWDGSKYREDASEYSSHFPSTLTKIEIPKTVTEIGAHAFKNCENLKTINIPNSVTDIIDAAFVGCTSLTSITIPNSVTYIGSYAFSGCSSLKTINYGGTKAQWTKIFSDASVPSGVKVICSDGTIITS